MAKVGIRRRLNALQFFGGGNLSGVDKVYIPCAPTAAINVGASDFTIEWLKVRLPTDLQDGTATAGANYSWINSPIAYDRDTLNSVGSGGDFGVSFTTGRVTFGVENSAAAQRTIIGTTNLRDAADHHVAVTRERATGTISVFVDGTREATSTGPTGDVHYTVDAADDTWNHYVCLGGEKHRIDWSQGQWRGWMRGVRVSNSLRYTGSTYTTPTAFTPDSNTMALYKCDQGYGTLLIDSSSNANHGDLVVGGASNGPQWASLP